MTLLNNEFRDEAVGAVGAVGAVDLVLCSCSRAKDWIWI